MTSRYADPAAGQNFLLHIEGSQVRHTPTACAGLADPRESKTSDLCAHRLASAQNAQIGTAIVLIGLKPTSAHKADIASPTPDRYNRRVDLCQ